MIRLLDHPLDPTGIETNTKKPAWWADVCGEYRWVFIEIRSGVVYVVGYPIYTVVRVKPSPVLAGPDLGGKAEREARRAERRAAREARSAYRDYTFDDGYTYRQYKTGEIRIMISPKGDYRPDGRRVSRGSKAWQAIKKAIDEKKRGDATTAALTAAEVVTSLLAQRGEKAARSASDADGDYDDDDTSTSTRGAPSWLAPVLVGLGAVVVGSFALSRGGG